MPICLRMHARQAAAARPRARARTPRRCHAGWRRGCISAVATRQHRAQQRLVIVDVEPRARRRWAGRARVLACIARRVGTTIAHAAAAIAGAHQVLADGTGQRSRCRPERPRADPGDESPMGSPLSWQLRVRRRVPRGRTRADQCAQPRFQATAAARGLTRQPAAVDTGRRRRCQDRRCRRRCRGRRCSERSGRLATTADPAATGADAACTGCRLATCTRLRASNAAYTVALDSTFLT